MHSRQFSKIPSNNVKTIIISQLLDAEHIIVDLLKPETCWRLCCHELHCQCQDHVLNHLHRTTTLDRWRLVQMTDHRLEDLVLQLAVTTLNPGTSIRPVTNVFITTFYRMKQHQQSASYGTLQMQYRSAPYTKAGPWHTLRKPAP